MRRRIVRTTVVVTALTLLLFSAAVVWTAGSRISQSEQRSTQVQADRIATLLSTALEREDATPPIVTDEDGARVFSGLEGYLREGEQVDVRMPDGRVLTFGESSPDQRVSATSEGRPVQVTVRHSGDNGLTAAVRVGVVLIMLGALALTVAWFISRRLADRLVAPLGDLAAAAARLGRGDARPAGLRYDIVELDAVAEVLDVSAQRIGAQISTERRLAADVSHQLRTPLTALSMRLEEVLSTEDPEVARAEARIALQQVERLSRVVDDLLAYARHDPAQLTDVDLDTVIAQQAAEWQGAYQAAGRRVDVAGEQGLVAHATASGLSQVVSTLLENALVHGDGTTTVRTRMSGRWTVVEVMDEGPGVPAALVGRIFDREFSGASRTGLGLAVARALLEVEGGRLELTRRHPATFTAFLPPRQGRTEEGQRPEASSASGTSASGTSGSSDSSTGV